MAVPQVVAHRVSRMALAGPSPNARDRREFIGMVAEKQVAFAQSWFNLITETARLQQQLALSLVTGASPSQHARRVTSGLTKVANRTLAPVHRKAVANSKRLAKTKLR